MKNTLFKKVLAVALACTMTFSMATVTHAADAKEITIGVTSFADTLEPTEQYFSWVVSRYAIGECHYHLRCHIITIGEFNAFTTYLNISGGIYEEYII